MYFLSKFVCEIADIWQSVWHYVECIIHCTPDNNHSKHVNIENQWQHNRERLIRNCKIVLNKIYLDTCNECAIFSNFFHYLYLLLFSTQILNVFVRMIKRNKTFLWKVFEAPN